jgi:hypothetical protein
MDRSGPAAVGAAGMFELLELDAKRVIELRHGSGEDDRPPAVMLFDDGKTVLVCKLLDGLDVGWIRTELLGILVMGQVPLRLIAGGDFPNPFL